MKTDDLLCRALLKSGLAPRFVRIGLARSVLYPAGVHCCDLPMREGATAAELRFAASELGLPRVELLLLLPELQQADTVALYERVQHLWMLDWPCHFSRLERTRQIQVRAQVFTGVAPEAGEPLLDDMPVARDVAGLVQWLRTSYAAARTLLRAYAGQVS
ncbi:hypothetical protein HHL11_02010 [Ramlibacter sp. G-1-2-2]|uniref:Uncharacterized protein n=1 Tax=Ramlibacter agri TaxID=2728837 RepID=A0A848GV69_9BURK|nr:hypothetical protein [Ramlibacter agri]NML42505.1 hypothetical protein [Ramlibacter agri]